MQKAALAARGLGNSGAVTTFVWSIYYVISL